MNDRSFTVDRNLSRRTVLRGLAVAAAGVAGGSVLAGCSGGPATAPTTTAGPAKPGGTLRAALVGSGAAETLQPFQQSSTLDTARAKALHGVLGTLDPNAPDGVRYQVLTGIDRAADLSSYTLRVRKGLKFTDGSPVTARDVLASLALAASTGTGHYVRLLADFDLDRARADGDDKVLLPTRKPIADGHLVLCMGTAYVLKAGTTNVTKDLPTCGPFKLIEFEPGRGSKLARHDGFAGDDLSPPRLDGVELLSIADPEARLNALRGHQVDFVHDLTPVQAKVLATDNSVRVLESAMALSTGLVFELNLGHQPFQDLRVRQAFKYAIDRRSIVDNVLFGRGHIGNDLFSLGFPDYAGEVEQLNYDPDRARALLREAGAANLPITLTTGPETAGMVEAATLVVEHLSKVGVRAKLDARPPGQLFTDYMAYTQLPFAGSYSVAVPAMLYYQSLFTAGSPSGFGWNRPDVDALVVQARGTADAGRSKAAAVAAQRLLWAEGNTIVPAFRPMLCAANPSVAPGDGLLEQYPGFLHTGLR